MPAHLKIVAGLLFIIVGVATSISNWQAFIGYFLLIGIVLAIAQLPIKKILSRATVEIPFVLFAFLMPFFGTGEKFELFGLSLYREGLLAGAAIIALALQASVLAAAGALLHLLFLLQRSWTMR